MCASIVDHVLLLIASKGSQILNNFAYPTFKMEYVVCNDAAIAIISFFFFSKGDAF